MKQEEFARSHTASVVSRKVRETSHLCSHVGISVYISIYYGNHAKGAVKIQFFMVLRRCGHYAPVKLASRHGVPFYKTSALL